MDCKKGVLSVLKPPRPLTEFEQDVLKCQGMENNPIVIEALNIFEGRIVGRVRAGLINLVDFD